jgi:hypothetical protein
MSRLAIFLVVAFAALSQANIQPAPLNQDGPLCKDCEKIIASLKKIIDNPQTEDELETSLKAFCTIPVLANYKDQCLELVNYIIVGLHELQSLLDDPTAVCKSIHFCNNDKASFSSFSKRMTLSVASKIIQDIHQPANLKTDTCKMCTDGLNDFKQILETPEVVAALTSNVEGICKYFGGKQADCLQIVDWLFPNLLKVLGGYLEQPQQICGELKLCQQSTPAVSTFNDRLTTLRVNRFLSKITTMPAPVGIDMGCMACEVAITAVIKLLSKQSVEQTIAQDFTKFLCKLFPKTIQPGCVDWLGIYAVPSMQLTLSEWTPQEICQGMHACSARFAQQLTTMPKLEKSVAVCDACKMLSGVLSFELQQANFQQDIINVFNRVCKLLPGGISNQCGELVIQYVPAGLSYVADFLTRDDACSVLHLC